MSVLTDLVAAISSDAIEVIDLTAPLSAETPILRLPEPLGQTWRFGLTEISTLRDWLDFARDCGYITPRGACRFGSPLPRNRQNAGKHDQ